MDMIGNLTLGLQQAVTPTNLLYCLLGSILGTLVGVLPGLGPAATIALLLPLTMTLDPTTALIMLAGIYYGAQYGGSTTAILVNLPGEVSSVITAIDGYQLARQGKAGLALATSAIGSFCAGTFATLVVAMFAPVLAGAALLFGAPEYLSLMVLGLIASVTLAQGSLIKALAMIVIGLIIGVIGIDVNSGVSRFDFGIMSMMDGISIVSVAMGLFGIAEIMENINRDEKRSAYSSTLRGLMPTRAELKTVAAPIARGTLIGTVLGILPGGGAMIASFAAYVVEKKRSREPERFGKGAIEGVAAPESANNAGAQTSFIPLLTLGIPSNGVMALMAGAMIIQGIQPGPNVMTNQPGLFWGLIVSMWVGNLFLLVLNLPLIGIWVRLLTIPYKFLFPAIVAFCCIGAYTLSNNVFDIYVMLFFGLVGYGLRRLRFEATPLLLGLVLGPMMEEYLRRSLLLSRGSAMIFIERPISLGLLLVAAVLVVLALMPAVRRRRDEALQE